MKLHPQYVTDDNGERTGVILPLEEFHRMVEKHWKINSTPPILMTP